MSHSGGRGLGRAAGRGSRDSKKPQSSSSTTSVPRSKPSSVKSSSSQSEIGQSRAGFPASSKELHEQMSKMSLEEKKGDGSGAPAIGRGGIRGRRVIPVVEVVKTKPETCSSKQGNYGNKIQLVTNYFKLETVTDWSLYQYRVDFSADEERETVLRSWLRQHRERLGGAYIFDGTMLFISHRLSKEKEPLELTSFTEPDNTIVKITLKLVQQLNYGNFVYLQVFNILVRRCLMNLNLQLVHQNYFDPKAAIHLAQHCLDVWPGYITSIRQHENDVLMCAEITHKVMRTDTALKFFYECAKDKNCKQLFLQGIVGSIVLTDYNNKTYRVDDVDFSVNPQSTFKYRDNEVISYVEYYKKRYQIKITDMNQPLLVSRASARDLRGGKDKLCLLVPELCRMTGLTSRMLDNRNLMKDLADITRIGPAVRMQRLKEFNNRLQNEPSVAKDFKDWGMTLSRDLITLPGREFPPEQIFGGTGASYSAGHEVDWTRQLRSAPMFMNGKFENFIVICPYRIKRETEEFLGVLKKAADGMKFRIPRPIVIDIKSDTPLEYLEATEGAISKYCPDLIMYGFMSDRPDRYNAVKRKCYVDRGIPSQVVLARSMKAKGVLSIATKIAVQMNCKVGGAPWTIGIPAEHVMVIGFDVCHDKNKSNSVGALVASLNRSMSTWYSTVNFHSSGEELSNTISLDLCKALRKYQEYNKNVLPNKIFFYRDGVGEGQLHHVYEHEVAIIKTRLTEIYGGETWKMAYIIVTKRINTRFFLPNGQNPVPGTIVDDVITRPEQYDFFLVSQSVRQGTVSPTSYNVISDNLEWPPNYIQRFSYKMTHLYFNCSATVRVPAPCQYAHKLAFMVSQNLQSTPNPKLNTSLYFL